MVQADKNSQCPRGVDPWETSYTNPIVISFLDISSREYNIMWNCQDLACSQSCGDGNCGNCETLISTAGTVFSVVLDSTKPQNSLRLQSDPVLCDLTSGDLVNETAFVLGQNNTCRADSNLGFCLEYTDCASCAQDDNCGWCNGVCISINQSATGKKPTISCPSFISQQDQCCPTYKDCQSCSSSSIGCGFCYDEPQGSCYKLNSSSLPPPNVQCITWQLNSSQCTFQTANQTVPIRQGAEKKSTVQVLNNNTLSIWTGSQFQSVFFSVVELPRMYGGLPLANLSKYTIMDWYQYASDLNVDALYFHDLLPPLFYKLLEIFNSGKSKPLRFFQVIQPTLHFDMNTILQDNNKIISDTVNAIHGNSGSYVTDVSPLLAGWILGEAWSQPWLAQIDTYFSERIFSAQYFVYKKKSGISYVLIDVWLSNIVTAEGNYGWEHPVALGNNYSTDPITHPYAADGAENVTLDATVATGRTGKVSYFATMRANPYDSVPIRYEYLNCPLCDNSGEDPYSGYLRHLKSIYSGLPVLLTGIGFGTSEFATAYAPLGRDDGGHSETEQGNILSEVITRSFEEKYAGISMKCLVDDWSQESWNTKLIEQNPQKWKNHYNPLQNMGLIGLTPLLYNSSGVITIDGSATEWTNRTAVDLGGGSGRAWHDAENLYLLITASPAKLWDNQDTLWIGVSVTGEGTRRIEPVAGDFILSLDMYLQIQGNYNNLTSGVFVRNGYNPLLFYYPSQIPNGTYDSALVYNTSLWRIPSEFAYQAGCDFYQAVMINAGTLKPQVHYARSQQHIEVKIPWTLLGFVDPSARLVWDYLPPQSNSSTNYTLATKTASTVQFEFVRYSAFDQSVSQWTGILGYSIPSWTSPPVSVRKKAGFSNVASTILSLQGETPPTCTRSTSPCWIEKKPDFCGATTDGTTGTGRPSDVVIPSAGVCPQSCQIALGVTIPFLCIIAGVVAFIWFKTRKKKTQVENLVNKMEEKAPDIAVPVNLRVKEAKKKSLASKLRDEVLGSRPSSRSGSRPGSRGSYTASTGTRTPGGGWTPTSQMSWTPTENLSGTSTPGGSTRPGSANRLGPNRTRSGSLPANFKGGSRYSTRRNTPGMTPMIGTSPLITPGLTPLMTPGQTPGLTPIQTPGITPLQTPGMTPAHTPGITPSHTPGYGMTPSHTPGITPIHTPGITPIHTPGITPIHTPGITPIHTPGVTPGATPSHTPLMSRRNSLDGSLPRPPKELAPLRAPPSIKSPSESDNNNIQSQPLLSQPNQVVPFEVTDSKE